MTLKVSRDKHAPPFFNLHPYRRSFAAVLCANDGDKTSKPSPSADRHLGWLNWLVYGIINTLTRCDKNNIILIKYAYS